MSERAAFLAYPSDPHYTADAMGHLRDALHERGWEVATWEDPGNTGPLFADIAARIDASDVFLGETTTANPNVLFEPGYAIARGKAAIPLVDMNTANRLSLPPLEIVRYVGYDRVADAAEQIDAIGRDRRTSEELGLNDAESAGGSIYFIPARRAGELNDVLDSVIHDTWFDRYSIDFTDPDYDSLRSQANSIARAEVVVRVLVDTNTKEHQVLNGQMMLYMGIAAGLGKHYLVLSRQPHRRLIDLGDSFVPFESEQQAQSSLRFWLNRVGPTLMKITHLPKPVRSEFSLAGMFLGNLDARSDLRLTEHFVSTPEFVQARNGDRHLFFGAKGTGKTALYEMLLDEFADQKRVVIEIAPRDFEFPRLAGALSEHVDVAHQEFVFGSFWRYVLLTEILRGIRDDFMDTLLRADVLPEQRATTRRARMESKTELSASVLVNWINESHEKLDLDFVSRVERVLDELKSVEGSADEKRQRYEQILLAARMYEFEEAVSWFASTQAPIHLLVDDLDRNWSPYEESSDLLLVSLMHAIQDLKDKLDNFLPVIFVRKDVFDWLKTGDPEILRRDPEELTWSREQLKQLIASRILSAAKMPYDGTSPNEDEVSWSLLFPERLSSGELPSDWVVDRTMLRPREMIYFCQQAVSGAHRAGRATVEEDDLLAAWEKAGQNTLSQLEVEERFVHPRVSELILGLMAAPSLMPWDVAMTKFREAATGVEPPVEWLQTVTVDPEAGLAALYRMGVVGLESRPSGDSWFVGSQSFEALRAVRREHPHIRIHPAFQKFLGCTDETEATEASMAQDATKPPLGRLRLSLHAIANALRGARHR